MFHFFKRPAAAAAPEPERPPRDEFESVLRYRCEVRSMDDRPVFVADAKEYDGASVRLYPTMNFDAPPVIYNNQYKLVFRVPEKPIPVWTARVRGSSGDFWKVDDLTRFENEKRTAFRQRVNASAKLRALQKLPDSDGPLDDKLLSPGSLTCQLIDMSMNGLQLRSKAAFDRGDLLAVTGLRLARDPQPFTLPFRVRWTERDEEDTFRCGGVLEFVDRNEEDRLCAAFFGLQRAAMLRF